MKLPILAASLAALIPARGAAQPAPPAALPLAVATPGVELEALLAGGEAWAGIATAPIHLSQTPPLYPGDPAQQGAPPEARVSLARVPGALVVRLVWTDATNRAPRPPERVADAGEAAIYPLHSHDLERFADAACVMTPRLSGERAAYPSLMMGEPDAPVDLYYWHQVRGFERLAAAGRGTTRPTGERFSGAARRTEAGWEVVFRLPDLPVRTPVAFALWDGAQQQRDGLKFFSLWYELAP